MATDTKPRGRDAGVLTVNMGPQHPSTHGVLRLSSMLDGEIVVHCRPVIGYLHTGFEKTFEAKTTSGRHADRSDGLPESARQ